MDASASQGLQTPLRKRGQSSPAAGGNGGKRSRTDIEDRICELISTELKGKIDMLVEHCKVPNVARDIKTLSRELVAAVSRTETRAATLVRAHIWKMGGATGGARDSTELTDAARKLDEAEAEIERLKLRVRQLEQGARESKTANGKEEEESRAVEIKERILQAKGPDGIAALAGERWTARVYERTQLSKSSIISSRKYKIFLHDPSEDEL